MLSSSSSKVALHQRPCISVHNFWLSRSISRLVSTSAQLISGYGILIVLTWKLSVSSAKNWRLIGSTRQVKHGGIALNRGHRKASLVFISFDSGVEWVFRYGFAASSRSIKILLFSAEMLRPISCSFVDLTASLRLWVADLSLHPWSNSYVCLSTSPPSTFFCPSHLLWIQDTTRFLLGENDMDSLRHTGAVLIAGEWVMRRRRVSIFSQCLYDLRWITSCQNCYAVTSSVLTEQEFYTWIRRICCDYRLSKLPMATWRKSLAMAPDRAPPLCWKEGFSSCRYYRGLLSGTDDVSGVYTHSFSFRPFCKKVERCYQCNLERFDSNLS